MKKILFVLENLRGGGAEKVLLTLLKRFDYKRYDVSVCLAYPEGVYLSQLPAAVHRICLYDRCHSFCRKSFRYYRRYGIDWLLKYQIKKKRELFQQYDVMVSFLEGRALLLHSLLLQHASRHITWVHCDLSTYHWTKATFPNLKTERKCYEAMHQVVFVSQAAQHGFEQLFQIDTPCKCIYNPLDVAQLQALAVQEPVSYAHFMVTAIGTVNRVKAFDKLVRVARNIKLSGYPIYFQIIGEEDPEQSLRKLCVELDVADRFTFAGFRTNPYPLLQASQLYVSTSLSEGFSLTICEAMSLGVPVISTPTAGAVEVLDGGRYGMLVTHEEASIEAGILSLYEDASLRASYAEKGKERSLLFQADKIMQQIYQVLD